MENHYKLRIKLINGITEKQCLDVVGKRVNSYLYCREGDGIDIKHHLHFYLILKEGDVKEPALRKGLRTLGRGNQVWSLRQLDLEENPYALKYLAYCTKEEDYQLVNFSQEWVNEAREHDIQVKEEMKQLKKERKEKKKSRYTRIMEQFEEQYPDTTKCDMQLVIQFLIVFFVEEKSNTSVSTISSWTNTIMMKYNIGDYQYLLSALVSRQLSII